MPKNNGKLCNFRELRFGGENVTNVLVDTIKNSSGAWNGSFVTFYGQKPYSRGPILRISDIFNRMP